MGVAKVRAAVEAGQVVFTSDSEDVADAYVDADLLPVSGEVEIDAIRAESQAAAARVYAGRAAAVADALRSADGPVEVLGTGITASLVRSLIPATSEDDRPGTIVDLGGEPENLVAATRRLRDLGTIFLAAPSGGRLLDIDLYPEVHLRGLRLVGAPPEVLSARATDVDLEVETPEAVYLGQPAALGRRWYQVSGRKT